MSGPRTTGSTLLLLGLAVLVGCGGEVEEEGLDLAPGAEMGAPEPLTFDSPGTIHADSAEAETDPAEVDTEPEAMVSPGEGPPRAQTPPPPPPGLEGRVTVTGSGPSTFPLLERAGEAPLGLTGPLAGELERLAGARVWVDGEVGPGFPGTAMEVERYEVVSIDGERPRVGTLVEGGDGQLALETEEGVLPLASPPRDFTGWGAGAGVWIVGPMGEDGLEVVSYGLIRPVS